NALAILPQHGDNAVDAFQCLVDFFRRVVVGDADAHHAIVGRNAELVDHLPGIVVPGPDKDVFRVHLAHDGFGHNVINGEGNRWHALANALGIGDAVDGETGNVGKAVDQPL